MSNSITVPGHSIQRAKSVQPGPHRGWIFWCSCGGAAYPAPGGKLWNRDGTTFAGPVPEAVRALHQDHLREAAGVPPEAVTFCVILAVQAPGGTEAAEVAEIIDRALEGRRELGGSLVIGAPQVSVAECLEASA